jgi:hypothetical protein
MVNQQKLEGLLRNLESTLEQLRAIASMEHDSLVSNAAILSKPSKVF